MSLGREPSCPGPGRLGGESSREAVLGPHCPLAAGLSRAKLSSPSSRLGVGASAAQPRGQRTGHGCPALLASLPGCAGESTPHPSAGHSGGRRLFPQLCRSSNAAVRERGASLSQTLLACLKAARGGCPAAGIGHRSPARCSWQMCACRAWGFCANNRLRVCWTTAGRRGASRRHEAPKSSYCGWEGAPLLPPELLGASGCGLKGSCLPKVLQAPLPARFIAPVPRGCPAPKEKLVRGTWTVSLALGG